MAKKRLIYEGEYELKNRIEKETGDIIFSIEKERKYSYTFLDYGSVKNKREIKNIKFYTDRVVRNSGVIYRWIKRSSFLFNILTKLGLIRSLEESFDERVENAYRKAKHKLRELNNEVEQKLKNECMQKIKKEKREEQNYYNASDTLQRAKKNVHQEIRTLSWLDSIINSTSYAVEKSIKRAEQNEDFINSMILHQYRSSLEEIANCSYGDPEAAEMAKNDIIEMLNEIKQKATEYYKKTLEKNGNNIKVKIKSQKEICNTQNLISN